MALQSSIEWTEATWNPVTGCSKISPGCKHCYAERMAQRLQAIGHPHYRDGFKVTLHEDALGLPLRWKRPQAIFVNSMSDLYHRDVPFSFIKKVFDVMHQAHWHRYQILTKRAERLAELIRLDAQHEETSMDEESTIVDDRLRLIFTCCHPALEVPARVALTLRAPPTPGGSR